MKFIELNILSDVISVGPLFYLKPMLYECSSRYPYFETKKFFPTTTSIADLCLCVDIVDFYFKVVAVSRPAPFPLHRGSDSDRPVVGHHPDARQC